MFKTCFLPLTPPRSSLAVFACSVRQHLKSKSEIVLEEVEGLPPKKKSRTSRPTFARYQKQGKQKRDFTCKFVDLRQKSVNFTFIFPSLFCNNLSPPYRKTGPLSKEPDAKCYVCFKCLFQSHLMV